MRTTSPSSIFSLSVILRSSSSACALGNGGLALGDDELGQGVGLGLELLAAGDEVGLALQLDDGADVAVDDQRDDALVVLAVVALGAGGQALLAQPLLGGLHVAVVGLEGLLGVHHARRQWPGAAPVRLSR